MKIKWNLKRACGLVFGIFLMAAALPKQVMAADYWPEAPEVDAQSAIVMEQSTGTVIYDKNITEKQYPASITKIMTVLVALENVELNQVVTFSNEAIDNTEGSGIARDYGEQMTLEQCLYAIMLESANECAYAVAEEVGGSVEGFVDMMNAKAKELGCVNTHFANPHGLPDENHYTCAYDMALITQAAYNNETFRIITGTARYTIPPTNKHDEATYLNNHNELLVSRKFNYVYPYCVGGKTGYTDDARYTLVTISEKDGMTLICVVMRTEVPHQWEDSIALFDYAFDNFQLFNVAENETSYNAMEKTSTGSLNTNEAFVDIDRNASIVLPKTAEFSDASSSIVYDSSDKDVAGTIEYRYADRVVGKADIVRTGVQIQGFVFDNEKMNEETESVEEQNSVIWIHPWVIVLAVLGVVALVVIGFVIKYFVDNIYIIRHNREVRKQRKDLFGSGKRIRKKHKRRRRR